MKKWLAVVLALITVCSLVACKKEPVGDPPTVNGQDYFDAVVTQVHDNYILAECTENASGAISVGTEVSVSKKNISSEEIPELEAGDHIRVVYAGEIMEKDPPGFQQIISVFAVNEDGSIITGDTDGEHPELPGLEDEGFPNWGLTLSVKDVTASGLTLICTQSGGELTGELETGSDYSLKVLEDGTWTDVPTVIEEYGWTAEAYMVPMEDSVEFQINWEWLYGELPKGTYRITKGFMDFRGTGDYDNFAYWTEFEIK